MLIDVVALGQSALTESILPLFLIVTQLDFDDLWLAIRHDIARLAVHL